MSFVVLKVNKEYRKIEVDKIRYVSGYKNYILIHYNPSLVVRSTFKEMFLLFRGIEFFVMPTYGCLVNINYIERVDDRYNRIILYDKTILPISRNYKSKFLKEYLRYTKYKI